MNFALAGISHKTAGIELRERASLSDSVASDRLASLVAGANVGEALLLVTCNRSELYIACENGQRLPPADQVFANVHDCPLEALSDHLYRRQDDAVVDHLFRVAAGVESMVFGETEIMGQIKHAAELGRSAGSVKKVLGRLADCALAVGKRVRTETEVGRGAMSVASVAVDLARQIFDDLSRARVLVVGAGENGELLARRMADHGARDIVVTSRTFERAARLAEQVGARAVAFECLADELLDADVIISSTSAPHHLITADHVREAAGRARGRPMFFIDLAVPRDIDPRVQEVEDVYLYDMDDLETIASEAEDQRRGEMVRVEPIIEEEAREFLLWANSLEIVPMMLAIRDGADSIREEEFDQLLDTLPDLTQKQRKAIHLATKQIVRRILHRPLESVREVACEPEGRHALEVVQRLFGVGAWAEPENSAEGKEPSDRG